MILEPHHVKQLKKLINCTNEYEIILSGKSHYIFSYYFKIQNLIGFIKKEGNMYAINEDLNEIRIWL